MQFFLFFCDNNLSTISTFPKDIQYRIEHLEHEVNMIKSAEDVENARAALTRIINDICALKITNENVLYFIGGMTMIERMMAWDENSQKVKIEI